MINFIICDDNVEMLKKIRDIILNIMMNNDNEYKIHLFNDYNQKLKNIIETKLPNKIYILDIDIPSSSGIEIARKIRQNDYQSTIIFITVHEELGYKLLQKEFLFLSFINKYDDYEEKLIKALKISMDSIDKGAIFKYKKNGAIYSIPINDIIYVTRNSVERKCVIKTDYLELTIGKQLKDLKRDLSDDFIFSHRSCLVNKSKIRYVDFSNHVILLSNGKSLDMVSNLLKKEYD